MKYYEWWGEPNSVDVRFPHRHFNERWWMVEGQPVSDWQDSLTATYVWDDDLAFNFGLARNAWPVFSPELRSFFEDHKPGLIQFLPFQLQKPDGSSRVSGYSVGQILRLVDCLDRNRTQVEDDWEPVNSWGDFATLRPIVLSQPLIGDEVLFRIKGMCGSILIREDLKDLMENKAFKGQRFDFVECTP